MLISYTKDQEDKAYHHALLISYDNPRKRIILKYIYERPTYYAGYHSCSVEGNLEVKFSTHVEQKHLSTVLYLGEINSWSIPTQIKEMMIRNKTMRKRIPNMKIFIYNFFQLQI